MSFSFSHSVSSNNSKFTMYNRRTSKIQDVISNQQIPPLLFGIITFIKTLSSPSLLFHLSCWRHSLKDFRNVYCLDVPKCWFESVCFALINHGKVHPYSFHMKIWNHIKFQEYSEVGRLWIWLLLVPQFFDTHKFNTQKQSPILFRAKMLTNSHTLTSRDTEHLPLSSSPTHSASR